MTFKFNAKQQEFTVFCGERQIGCIRALDENYRRFYVEDKCGFWQVGCSFLEAVKFLEPLTW